MNLSVLVPFSEGLVASARNGSSYIEVFSLSVSGSKPGPVNADRGTVQEEGIDGQGKRYQVTMEFGDTIPARWLPVDTNRLTPPDVMPGERVWLYRVADSDQFFWRTLGLDNNLRRLETVIWAFSATTSSDDIELDITNSYFFEVSTHGKHITLNTSKANGEPFAYNFQIDTENGNFGLKDDDGQLVYVDSKERLIHLENKDGSILKLDKRNGLLVIPDTYEVRCKDYKLTAENSITQKTKTFTTTSDTHTVETTNYTLNSTSITFSGSSFNVSAKTSVKGAVKITGALGVSGDIKSKGKNVGGTHTHTSKGAGIPV